MAESADGGLHLTPDRELSADLYRVVAVAIVVIGHWLISAVTFRDGEFGNDYPLAIFPWVPWLTLVFQVVPVFFLVGGYASATAWMRWQGVGEHRWPDWVRQRVGALLGPTTVYVVLVLATIAVLSRVGIGRPPLSFGGWAVAMHLWFIPVYLVVGGADARGRSGSPAVGADGARGPGSGRCRGRCRRAKCAGGRLGELSAVLGGGVPDRNLLAWWATARTGALCCCAVVGSHSDGGVARVALLPDQHGRCTWRNRAEQLPSDRGTARVRRGANRGSWSPRRPP